MDNPLLLCATDLAVGYSGKTVMEGINLELHAGEFVCFMGPNGIGKSTVIRTLAGLQAPLKGSVDLGGKQKPAVVLTDRVTAGYMTVRQLVTFGRYPYLSWNLRLSPADHNAIEAAIEQLHIGDLANRRLHELSDGQLQLAQIGRALAQETPLIILDEPTAHLDLNNRLEITLLLRKLAHEANKGILMATHELDLALQTADQIWLAGRDSEILKGVPEDLVLRGSFDEIFGLKGFDLRTGRVQHLVNRAKRITINGNDSLTLWTRNAMERCGYGVTKDEADHVVDVRRDGDGNAVWQLDGNRSFVSVATLLEALEVISLK